MIKKILLFSCIIVFIPLIVVTIFIRDDEITFNFSSNTTVRVYRENLDSIDNVPIEEYVVGVVAGEMPVEFHEEALKAQSVAARSYVMKQIEKNINNRYDVIDTVINQVYLDREYLMSVWNESYTHNINKIKLAVLKTKGEYLTYAGNVVDALFFSTSAGYTENSEDVFPNKVEYLRSVKSEWDSISPAYTSIVTYTLAEFYNLLNLEYNDELNVEIIDKTETGRPKSIKINGILFDSKTICSKLKLKSTYFNISYDNKKIIIDVKGYGHGVGMSQYGAEGMANLGYTYDSILKYYYTGVEIKKF